MYLLRRLQECLILLVLLFVCATCARGANVVTALFSSTPVVNMCQAGPTATTFTSADPRVSLYLVIEKMAAGDIVILEWVNPSGSVVQTFQFSAIPSAGGYCYARSQDIEGTSEAAQTGKWTVRVLLNGSRLSAPTFTLTAAPRGTKPTVNAGGVVNGADFTANFAPGILLSIYGAALAPRTAVAAEAPLPLALEGTFVEVTSGGKVYRAPIFFVSAGQINAQLPFELASAATTQLRVFTASGGSMPEFIRLSTNAPRLLTATMDGRGEAIVAHAGYTLVSGTSPAKSGEVLLAFLTGLGAVTPAIASGRPAGDNGKWGPLNWTVDKVTVEVNGKPATVSFSGLAPGWIGLYQVNFQVPDGVSDAVSLVIKTGGVESQRNVTLRCSSGGGAPLGSMTIPATGGTLNAGPVSITVPAGAFPAAATLTAERVTESSAPPASQISAMYSIQGLPEETTGSITITLQSSKSNPDPNKTYVVIEEQGEGGGRMIVKATVQGDRISVVLPKLHQLTPHTQGALSGKGSLAAASDGKSASNALNHLIWAFEDEVWTRGNFKIYGGAGMSNEGREQLADQLDRALAWLEAAGLNWRSKRSGPIEVDCTHSYNFIAEVRYSLSGSAEGHLVVNTFSIPMLRGTNIMAYPLARLVTDLFYPSPQLLRPQDRLAWMWLDSAVGNLATAGTSDDPSPFLTTPDGFVTLLREGLDFNRKSTFQLTKDQKAEVIDHGRHATRFLISLHTKEGNWRWLGRVYNLRPPTRAGAAWISPIEALALIREKLSTEWLDYCREGQRTNFAAVLKWAQERTYKVNDINQPSQKFQAPVADLAALPHLIDTYGDWPSLTKMTLTVSGPNTVAVVDRLTKSMEWRSHLGIANPELEIEPFFPLDPDFLLVTVVNTRVDRPPAASVNAQVSMTMSNQYAVALPDWVGATTWISVIVGVQMDCTQAGKALPLMLRPEGSSVTNYIPPPNLFGKPSAIPVTWTGKSFQIDGSDGAGRTVNISGSLSGDLTVVNRIWASHKIVKNGWTYQTRIILNEVKKQRPFDATGMYYWLWQDEFRADIARYVVAYEYSEQPPNNQPPILCTPRFDGFNTTGTQVKVEFAKPY